MTSSFPRRLGAALGVVVVPTLLGLFAGHAWHIGDHRVFWGLVLGASVWFMGILRLEPRLRKGAALDRAP